MLQDPTEATTTCTMTREEKVMIEEEEMIEEEGMIEGEETLRMTMKKALILKREQEIPCMKIMQQLINLNIFLFLLFLVLPLRICITVGR